MLLSTKHTTIQKYLLGKCFFSKVQELNSKKREFAYLFDLNFEPQDNKIAAHSSDESSSSSDIDNPTSKDNQASAQKSDESSSISDSENTLSNKFENYLSAAQRLALESQYLQEIKSTDIPMANITNAAPKIYMKNMASKLSSNLRYNQKILSEYQKESGVDVMPSLPTTINKDVEREFMITIQANKLKNDLNDVKEDLPSRIKKTLVKVPYIDMSPKYVKEYPGSLKGPHPEDDPEFYFTWLKENIHPAQAKMLNPHDPVTFGLPPDTEFDLKNTANASGSQGYMSDTFNSQLPLTDHLDEIAEYEIINLSSNRDSNPVPLLPDIYPTNMHDAAEVIEKWAFFRIFPAYSNFFRHFLNVSNVLELLNETRGEKKIMMPSLFTYYNTLPDFAKKHPIVINVLKHLEINKPTVSNEAKEMALNYACMFTLPLEPVLAGVCSQAALSNKRYLTAREEKVLWKALKTGDDIKNATEDSSESVVGEWPVPLQLDPLVPEDTLAPLPVQYYDNDDGFWDDYITKKEARHAEVRIALNRPYFKH